MRLFAIALMTVGIASAQIQPNIFGGQTPKKAGPARPPAARPATAPSYKDLKFPALRPIEIPKVETYTLPNGLRLYLLEDHELPLIHGTALVRTGNLFDPADKVGLATLTGSVMRTGGAASMAGPQIDEELENVAARVESEIGESSGSVSFSGLKDSIAGVLEIFQKVLTSPQFSQDKIDLIKAQTRSAISRRNDDAQEILQREFPSALYGKATPYGWDEDYKTIAAISRADMERFYKRYFFPKNVMLAVWGDFETAKMKADLEALFGGWTGDQPPVPAFPEVKPAATATYFATKKDVTQTFFSMGQMGGVLNDKDYPALEVMAGILGGGFQSRLFHEIRTKMGNAYDISADWGANYDHPGLFQISGSTKSLSTVETLRAVIQQVERMRTEMVSEQELATAKNTTLNSLVFAFDTKTKTLNRLLTYEYFGYPKDFIQQYQKALAAVTRADVLRVAQAHLDPAKFSLVAVGNPSQFIEPLTRLGRPVIPIDLTIPDPPAESAPSDPGSIDRGKKLLAAAQQAAGGVEALSAIKDYTQVADVLLNATAAGVRAKETERWLAPGYLREETELPSGKVTAFTDGQTGWAATQQGSGALGGPQLKELRADLFRRYVSMLLSDRIDGRSVNSVGEFAIEISDKDGNRVRADFDSKTNLLAKVTFATVAATGPSTIIVERYSDFRAVNGVQIPFKSSTDQGARRYSESTVTEFRINTGLKLDELRRRP